MARVNGYEMSLMPFKSINEETTYIYTAAHSNGAHTHTHTQFGRYIFNVKTLWLHVSLGL